MQIWLVGLGLRYAPQWRWCECVQHTSTPAAGAGRRQALRWAAASRRRCLWQWLGNEGVKKLNILRLYPCDWSAYNVPFDCGQFCRVGRGGPNRCEWRQSLALNVCMNGECNERLGVVRIAGLRVSVFGYSTYFAFAPFGVNPTHSHGWHNWPTSCVLSSRRRTACSIWGHVRRCASLPGATACIGGGGITQPTWRIAAWGSQCLRRPILRSCCLGIYHDTIISGSHHVQWKGCGSQNCILQRQVIWHACFNPNAALGCLLARCM